VQEVLRDDIYVASHRVVQLLAEAEELHPDAGFGRQHVQKVHVAVRSEVVSYDGSEHGQLDDAILPADLTDPVEGELDGEAHDDRLHQELSLM
jgi:hypothetical protein